MAAETTPTASGRTKYLVFSFIFGLPLLTFLIWWFVLRSVDTTIPITFDDTSEKLQRTVIVPTLDTPMPEGKNVIWCSSFQLAWNKLKRDIVRGPISLNEGQEVADRLNSAVQSESDLSEGTFYAAAGWDINGIQDEIRREMAKRFPGTPVHLPPPDELCGTAYGYLRANVKFTKPYFEHPEGFRFANDRVVTGFGLGRAHHSGNHELRNQVNVLYAIADAGQMTSYAIDLCRNSSPNQIVAAVLAPGATLAECLTKHGQYVATKGPDAWMKSLADHDELRVPNTRWRLEHHFKELENRKIQVDERPALLIRSAVQAIDFSLDKSGAALSSESSMDVGKKGDIAGPRLFYFDQPFLLIMKKRDAEHPFFVMWIENDELLQRK
jgi:hypothetical protein